MVLAKLWRVARWCPAFAARRVSCSARRIPFSAYRVFCLCVIAVFSNLWLGACCLFQISNPAKMCSRHQADSTISTPSATEPMYRLEAMLMRGREREQGAMVREGCGLILVQGGSCGRGGVCAGEVRSEYV